MTKPNLTYSSNLTEVIAYTKFLMEEINRLKEIINQMRSTLRYVETASYSGRERG